MSVSYDAASQTSQIIHRKSDGTSILQLDCRYDNAGNRNVMIENVSAARTTWAYDKQNQLLGEYRTGTNAYRQTFAYDPAGNRALKNVDGARTTYAYDNANQLKYGQAVAGRTSFSYDATGNQRIEQPPVGNRTTTTWNFENQPTQYLLPTGSPVTMSYNGDNRRILSQQGAEETRFVWDALVDAYLSELDGIDSVQAVYTGEPVQFGHVISQRRGTTSHWLHGDALGSVRVLTTNAQALSDSYLHDACGNLVASSGASVNPFRWIGTLGYYYHPFISAIYVRARVYKADTLTWLSMDPLLFVDGANLYTYAQNSPVFQRDPSGYFQTAADSGFQNIVQLGENTGENLFTAQVKPIQTNPPSGPIMTPSPVLPKFKFTMRPSPYGRADCGQTFGTSWVFEFTPKAPCDGWLVQQIYANRSVNYQCCRGLRELRITSRVEYLEAWEIRANQKFPIPTNLSSTPPETDTFSFNAPRNSKSFTYGGGQLWLWCSGRDNVHPSGYPTPGPWVPAGTFPLYGTPHPWIGPKSLPSQNTLGNGKVYPYGFARHNLGIKWNCSGANGTGSAEITNSSEEVL